MKKIAKLFPIQSVYHCGKDVGIRIIDIIRFRKNRDVPPFKRERYLSKLYYYEINLFQSHNSEVFPFSDGSKSSVSIKGNSSSISSLNDSQTKTYCKANPRLGLHCHRLLEIGNRLDRVQPQKVGSSLLPSAYLSERFDSKYQQYQQRFLTQRTSPWRYPYWNCKYKTHQGLICQTSSLCKECNCLSRQGFLGSRDHKIYGILEEPFYHCGQIDCPDQKGTFKPFLPPSFLSIREDSNKTFCCIRSLFSYFIVLLQFKWFKKLCLRNGVLEYGL